MKDNINNHVRGLALPGHRAFCEWLLNLGKRGDLFLHLGELDWAIRTQSMFQRDADVVRDFFQSLGEYLGTDSLKVVAHEGREIPFALLNGTKLPNTFVELELYFAQPNFYGIANDISATSKPIYESLKEFEGSEGLVALRQALKEISSTSQKDFATKNGVEKGVELIQKENQFHFYAETNTLEDRYRRTGDLPNLTEIYNRTIATANAVETSYTATRRMIDSYRERIHGLSQKLIAPPVTK